MSYSTWHEYGFGITFNAIDEYFENQFVEDKKETMERLFSFLSHSSTALDTFTKYLTETCGKKIDEDFSDITVVDVFGYESEGGTTESLIGVVQLLLNDVYGDNVFCDCWDFDNEKYLMLTPSYPWHYQYNNLVKDFTEETIVKIFDTVQNQLFGRVIEHATYLECENGG